ncbi:MAG: hypothetical protein ACFFBC_04005 [Promethearchaeota archaeon]
MEASYSVGARGIEILPYQAILQAARTMTELHNDYIITGSTYPGKDPGIEALINVGAKIIFVHGIVSDNKNKKLIKLLDEIANRGIIPGIATHAPISTVKYCIKNSLNVRVFLLPFNLNGFLMGNVRELEEIVDNTKDFQYIGMKTLAAGEIKPELAFNYIANHNISAVTIGMVTTKQAMESTEIALKLLRKKSS